MASEVVDRLRYEANLIRAERNGMKELTPRSQTIDEAADRIEELEAALRPFADIGPLVETTQNRDGERVHEQRRDDGTYFVLTRDDFRAARKALKP